MFVVTCPVKTELTLHVSCLHALTLVFGLFIPFLRGYINSSTFSPGS